MTVKTRGIVLGQVPLREQDRKLILLTSDLGLIEAVARGVTGAKSKYAAAAEILAYSDFCLFEGKSGYIVNSADLDRNFYDLRADLIKLSLASYFCELTRFVLPDKDNGDACLKLMLNTLWMLEKGKREPLFLKAVYELRLLAFCGFAPDLIGCTACGEEEASIFLPIDGVLCCEECKNRFTADRQPIVLPPSVRQAMLYICSAADDKLFSFRLNPDSEAALAAVTEYFTICQTGASFKSLEFLKSIS